MSWLNGARARLQLLFASRNAESRMMKEFGFHIEMETDRLVREEHLSHDEARRRALVAFGGLEKHKEELRDGRGLRWLGSFSLDLRLGFRMLRKYPGLTFVGVLALSVGIGMGAAYLEGINDLYRPTMPGPYGERIVRIYRWDLSSRTRDLHLLHDFHSWRTQLTTVEELGAFREVERNFATDDGRAEAVNGAEISAAGLRVMGDVPLLGRAFRDDEEKTGAPSVLVLSHALWLSRFGGDSSIIGRTVRYGPTPYTVVGVMPKGFAFPNNQHLWVPFRLSANDYTRGNEPPIALYGRLKQGVTLAQAQSELTNIAAPTAAQFPELYKKLQPRVTQYLRPDKVGDSLFEMRFFYALNLLFLGLLGVCAANVGTLVFARTATREGELTIRNALGASRARIVAQLFAEALVLTSIAAVSGLAAAAFILDWTTRSIATVGGFTFPFWWNDRLAPVTILYAGILALVAAICIGVFPALKATGRQLHTRLKSSTPSGSTLQLGRLWTGVIVVQVAVTVFFLFIIVSVGWNATIGQFVPEKPLVATSEYLTLQPQLDSDVPLVDSSASSRAAARRRYAEVTGEFERRLRSEVNVRSVSQADALPGMEHPNMAIEVEGRLNAATAYGQHTIRRAAVSVNFFDAFDRSIVAGRPFSAADVEYNRDVVVVDELFASRVLHNQHPVGTRIRQAASSPGGKPGPWAEIVGVVQNFTERSADDVEDGKVYQPIRQTRTNQVYFALHVFGDPKAMTARVNTIANEADPSLRLHAVVPMNEVGAGLKLIFDIILTVLVVLGAAALLLSTAGVYSMMSFTVARRTREIGIRSALGADPGRIVKATFSRGLKQIGVGVMVGSMPGGALIIYGMEGAHGAGWTTGGLMFAGVATFVLSVGLLACVVPARRALRIQPTEALRES